METTGPLTLAQVIPFTPITDQAAVPVGAAPPTVPATVAVKVKVEPRLAVGEDVVTVTIGVTCEIIIWNGVVGPAEV